MASLQRLFTADAGWFAQVGGLGDGSGLATGGGYRADTTDGRLTVRALASTRESYLASAEYRHALDGARRWTLVASVADRRDAQQQFAGTGPESSGQFTGYALTTTSAGAALEWQVAPALVAYGGVGSVRPQVTNSTNEAMVPVAQRFDAADVSGLHRQPTFGVFHGGLRLDTRDRTRTWGAGLYTLDWRHYDDRGAGRYSFTSLRVDAQHVLPIAGDSRHLVLHGFLQHTSAGAVGDVPFYMQPTLGGGRSLRGYDRQRFRDRSAVLLQTEFRQRVHRLVAATAFVDAGQVAPHWRDLGRSALRTNYGAGLRVGPADGPALRTEVALGGDVPARLVFGFGTTF